ncbi:hypothetical protein [Chamaesiphon sp. VAR_48_metabat_403]|uniref:hypothetical protein n=1 Tax=Chamaesiphon sp. VAR_48_metabat_403 TaxID=2964700 RepID=UPI00286D9135|nr:hypothetical protein [Chamaesiphon sp. VAR_48_metabat_403]
MSKFTSIVIGLLSAVAILPASQVMAATSNTPVAQQPSGDLHAQVILKLGPQYRRDQGYNSNVRQDRLRRRIDRAQEREARARQEAERLRARQNNRRYNRY